MQIIKRLELEYRYDADATRAAVIAAHELKYGKSPEGYVWECRIAYECARVVAVKFPEPASEPNDCEA